METNKHMKAVVFDLDDTLISEMSYVKSGFNHIAEIICQNGIHTKDEIYSTLMDLFHINSTHVFNRMFEALGLPYSEQDVLNLVDAYRNHQPQIEFHEDVLPCLQELKAMGIKVGIITDGFLPAQQRKLEALEASKYFDHIIQTEDLGRAYWKPHPKAFKLMREALDVEYDEMVYIGDNPAKDFFIGSIYPIQTVRIVREGIHHKAEYFRDIKEHHRIHSLDELFRESEVRKIG